MKLFPALIFLLAIAIQPITAQVQKRSANAFVLKGAVLEDENNNPVARVNIEISGGSYTTTNGAGEFSISAEIGDELIVKSDAFETVYYTIKDKQYIRIRVKNSDIEEASIPITMTSRNKNVNIFKTYIDSAKFYLKKDAACSPFRERQPHHDKTVLLLKLWATLIFIGINRISQ